MVQIRAFSMTNRNFGRLVHKKYRKHRWHANTLSSPIPAASSACHLQTAVSHFCIRVSNAPGGLRILRSRGYSEPMRASESILGWQRPRLRAALESGGTSKSPELDPDRCNTAMKLPCVTCLLSLPLTARLARAARTDFVVHSVNVESVAELTASRSGATIFVEPDLLDAPKIFELCEWFHEGDHSVVIYARLSSAALQMAVRMGAYTRAPCLVYDVNDDSSAIRRVLLTLPSPSATAGLLRMLEPRCRVAPPRLRRAIVAMVMRSDGADCPAELAARSQMSRRNVDRWCCRLGITSARMLVAAARIARAYDVLSDPVFVVPELAAAFRLSTATTLDSQCIAVTGLAIKELRAEPSLKNVLIRMQGALFSTFATTEAVVSVPSKASVGITEVARAAPPTRRRASAHPASRKQTHGPRAPR